MRLSGSTEDRRAVIPGVAVRLLLEPRRPERAVEGNSLVVHKACDLIGVAVDDVLGLFDADVTGDQQPALQRLLAAGQDDPAGVDLTLSTIRGGRGGTAR